MRHDYAGGMRAFYAISGRQPRIPRWALGNWWSRFHRYSEKSYLALMDKFQENKVRSRLPSSTWTGISSPTSEFPMPAGQATPGTTELFPDPAGFGRALHCARPRR